MKAEVVLGPTHMPGHFTMFLKLIKDATNSFFQQVVKLEVFQLKLGAKLNIIALKIPFVEIKTIILCFKPTQAKNNKSKHGVGLMKCYDTHSKVISIQITATCLLLFACRQFCKYFPSSLTLTLD